jgi:hypothetical protein
MAIRWKPVSCVTCEEAIMSLPLLYTALTATLLSADPPKPAPAVEELPAPRPVIVQTPFPGYYRRSAYDVWQNYSIARDMTWQTRVDFVPGLGYYYVYNGKPYYYAPIHQDWVTPTVQGTPYRSPEPTPVIIIQEEEVLPAPAVAKPAEAKPTSTKKAKRPAAKEPERMPRVEE